MKLNFKRPKGRITDIVAVGIVTIPLAVVGIAAKSAVDVRAAGRTTSRAFKLGLEEVRYDVLTEDVIRRAASDEVIEQLQNKVLIKQTNYINIIRQFHPELLPDIAKNFGVTIDQADLDLAEGARSGDNDQQRTTRTISATLGAAGIHEEARV